MSDKGGTWVAPDNSHLEGKALAPMFQVQSIKSYKPSDGSPMFETLLPFKRKQVITVLDWDEKRDAIYGEYDGKRGWFPSSYTKILANTPPVSSRSPGSPTDDDISAAASRRNAIPIDSRFRSQSASSVKSESPPPSEPSTPTPTSPGSFIGSPRMLGSLLGPILPSKNSLEETRKKIGFGNNSLKGLKLLSAQGIPLILLNIGEYARVSDGQFISLPFSHSLGHVPQFHWHSVGCQGFISGQP